MGLAGAKLLVSHGWKVTIFDFNEVRGEVVAALGSQALFVQGNVLLYDDQAKAFKETWDKWGRIDVGEYTGIGS
jgi:NAD(P)-dependent dehydrogenase (short-subunit alcohol dehydrogenase family)